MLALALRPSLNTVIKSLAAQAIAIAKSTGGARYVFRQSALSQDSAGATPVTGVEQPVGRVLDSTGNGHHLTATAAARGVYSRRVNLLTNSEFLNGVVDAPIRGGLVTASSMAGFAGALNIGYDGSTSTFAYSGGYVPIVGPNYTMTGFLETVDTLPPTSLTLYFNLNSSGGSPPPTIVNSLDGGRYELVQTNPVVSTNPFFGPVKTGIFNSQTFNYSGMQLVFGSVKQRYQRITTATDYDTAGFPEYLSTDGIDDSYASATGGGGTACICIVWAGQLTGGAGNNRNIWSDRAGTSGYIARVGTANNLELFAGNGSAFTNASTAGDTLVVGEKYVGTLFDNGVNLSVQINNGTPVTIARPAVAAGTAGFTFAASNTAASDYLPANTFGLTVLRNTAGTPAQREILKRDMAQVAGVTL